MCVQQAAALRSSHFALPCATYTSVEGGHVRSSRANNYVCPACPPAASSLLLCPSLPQKLQHAAFKHKMLLMPSGARESIRFLPPLNVSAQEINMALDKFEACCKEVFG
jgi:hypothetical protein